jgi:hypothetical protein
MSSTMYARSILRLALTQLQALVLAAAASGVIIDSGDGSGNTTAPVPDPGWHNIGTIGEQTGVYLGGRFVLTPHHVGPGNIRLDGVTYTYVPGTAVQLDNGDGTYADLILFEIYPAPPLPALPIASLAPEVGAPLIMAGNGYDRGQAITMDPNGSDPPGPTGGFEWGPAREIRWGTNSVLGGLIVEIPGTRTVAFETIFDQAGSTHEAQATVGDSGGAAFAFNGSGWELAGTLFAVQLYLNQAAATSFYGNATFAADLSFYRGQILDVMAMPEPSGGFWPGAMVVALLARRRRARGIRPLDPCAAITSR